MAIGINALRIYPAVGTYVYLPNTPQFHNTIVSASQTTPLGAGNVVTLDTTSTNPNCPVVKQAAVTDLPLGVVIFDAMKNAYTANQKIPVAREGSIVYLPAAGAITAGAKVMFNTDNHVTPTVTAGNSYIGTALTPAAAADDLVQVELKFEKTQAGG